MRARNVLHTLGRLSAAFFYCFLQALQSFNCTNTHTWTVNFPHIFHSHFTYLLFACLRRKWTNCRSFLNTHKKVTAFFLFMRPAREISTWKMPKEMRDTRWDSFKPASSPPPLVGWTGCMCGGEHIKLMHCSNKCFHENIFVAQS